MKKIVFLLLIAILSGCTTYWSRPNTSTQEANQDIYQCEREAAYAFPTLLTQNTTGSGYTTPSTTNCQMFGNQMNCTTMPGQYVPPPTYTMDMNAGRRQQAFSHCMMGKGYTASSDEHPRPSEPVKYIEAAPNYNEVCFQNCRGDGGDADTCRNKCNYQ
jgi:hypothetical protein